jgi:hypothetical protein
MELLVFYPTDTRPKKRHFDGPLSLGAQQAVGESAEVVPGFTSISQDGLIYPCVALLRPGGEAKRQSYERLGFGALARGAQAGGLRTWPTAPGWGRSRLAERQRGGSLHWGTARAKVTKEFSPTPGLYLDAGIRPLLDATGVELV